GTHARARVVDDVPHALLVDASVSHAERLARRVSVRSKSSDLGRALARRPHRARAVGRSRVPQTREAPLTSAWAHRRQRACKPSKRSRDVGEAARMRRVETQGRRPWAPGYPLCAETNKRTPGDRLPAPETHGRAGDNSS